MFSCLLLSMGVENCSGFKLLGSWWCFEVLVEVNNLASAIIGCAFEVLVESFCDLCRSEVLLDRSSSVGEGKVLCVIVLLLLVVWSPRLFIFQGIVLGSDLLCYCSPWWKCRRRESLDNELPSSSYLEFRVSSTQLKVDRHFNY